MKLTYRVDGDTLVSNQPSAPREERTHFVIQGDGTLILALGGEQSRFQRSEKRTPALEEDRVALTAGTGCPTTRCS